MSPGSCLRCRRPSDELDLPEPYGACPRCQVMEYLPRLGCLLLLSFVGVSGVVFGALWIVGVV